MSFERSDSFDYGGCAQTGTIKKYAWAREYWSKDEDASLLESARSQGATNGAKVYQSNLTRSLRQRREPLHFDSRSSSSCDSGYASLDITPNISWTFSDNTVRSMDELLRFGDESDNQRYQSQHQDGSQTLLSGLFRKLSDASCKDNLPLSMFCSPVDSGLEQPVAHDAVSSQTDVCLDGAVVASNQVGCTKDQIYQTITDKINSGIKRLFWQNNLLQTTVTPPIEASPIHQDEGMIVEQAVEPVLRAIRVKIL